MALEVLASLENIQWCQSQSFKISPAPKIADSHRQGGGHMVDFVYENLLTNAVKGVHLKVKVEVKMKVEVKGVHLNIHRDVRISFRCGCGGFVTSKALALVFNQPNL